MELELAERLKEVIESYNEDCRIYESYSGRGMYGKGTTGISTTVDIGTLLCMVIEAADEFVDKDGDPLFEDCHMRSDQLGLGMIYY